MTETIDSLALMLASGATIDAATLVAVQEFGMEPDDAEAAVDAARIRIVSAADYDRKAEIGAAYLRLTDIYRKSYEHDDLKTALAAQKELNKLTKAGGGSGTQKPEQADDSVDAAAYGSAADALQAVRGYLLPLGLAADDATTPEHARQAVAKIVALMGESE